jgi:GntR family transcriptional repressor for pyruvate dehydrogenase complex
MTTASDGLLWGSGPSPGLDRSHAADQIIEILRDSIARGQLARGTRLPSERVLSGHFGVSAPTIREATRALGALRLIESRHGSGTYVTADPSLVVASGLATASQLQDVSVMEILELLGIMNVHSAELAAENATADDLARLDEARQAIASGKSREAILSGLEQFVGVLADSAHRPLLSVLSTFLMRILVELERQLFPDTLEFWQEWTGSLDTERAEIADALAKHDAERLVAAVRRYHAEAVERVERSGLAPSSRMSEERFKSVIAAVTSRQ